ncbi:uncharacterized protein Z520_11200 [Fonsecaea multimorphosa CBS 102226]|uniref:Uncharacterized protein n=1 Tax=Fonsecaea multimorphosa CBS 102226 TaxID=1442371 RepID=A0A0D2K9S6_9EURO|nr:uncharacterized protein Z520_11200 [Fonsecaea multimorphosa CBS 102226]KIX93143.1 hypothetical protein Z520_11200 [Fonsecaea multimorphosa CBS 102226]OAL18343.1 hypothetical protein AYO22_10759 [Fonsecaea multimorphosa]
MWGKLLSVFKGKDSEGQDSRPTNQRHASTPSDPFGDDETENTNPPSSEGRDDPGVRLHHSLEQALGRGSRDEDAIDAEDDDEAEEVPSRHQTLEENIELARELSQELEHQAEELRRSASSKDHTGARSDKSQ